MSPFQAASLPPEAFDVDVTMRKFKLTRKEAEHAVARLRDETVYMNDRYQVNVRRVAAPFGPDLGDMLHLSIKRRSKSPVHDWRDLQAIKNMLVGPECEGLELYPAESRLVDTANQYHLWVFERPDVRLPVGWTTRLVGGPKEAESIGAKQREFK